MRAQCVFYVFFMSAERPHLEWHLLPEPLAGLLRRWRGAEKNREIFYWLISVTFPLKSANPCKNMFPLQSFPPLLFVYGQRPLTVSMVIYRLLNDCQVNLDAKVVNWDSSEGWCSLQYWLSDQGATRPHVTTDTSSLLREAVQAIFFNQSCCFPVSYFLLTFVRE